MGQIKAYRCDVCGQIREDSLPFTLEAFHAKEPRRDFKARMFAPGPEDEGACSIKCLSDALMRWGEAKREERKSEKPVEPAETSTPLRNGG